MPLRRSYLLATLAVVGIATACTLNPQPLPPIFDPDDGEATGAPGGGFGSDAGTRNDDKAPESDAAVQVPDSGGPSDVTDGGSDAGDTSDAGEAGDAGDAGDTASGDDDDDG